MYLHPPISRKRVSSGTTPVSPKILPVLALLLIALVCIAIPVGAKDALNNTTTLSAQVGNLTANETIANSTPAVNITYEPTAIPTEASLVFIDNTIPAAHDSALMNESAESSMASPVVTAAPLATSNPLAEDSIKATSAVAAPVAKFSGTPVSGIAPLSVSFTDASTGSPTGRAWYFGDETYNQTWTQQTVSASWSTRRGERGVVMPDGSIVITGGLSPSMNDVWRSTDMGKTWTRQTAHAQWSARSGHTLVVMPDGSIVLMGGFDSNVVNQNDVWRSTDIGKTWTQQTAHAQWSARYSLVSVVMPDGSIVMMGGNGGGRLNDVWRSTDMGKTWTQQTAQAQWSARSGHRCVVMQDGSIVLMAGLNKSGTAMADTWRSTDNGVTWTQQTAQAEWGLIRVGQQASPREDPAIVVMPDGSIVLLGGGTKLIGGSPVNDVWRSTDYGKTWAQVNANAGWPAREDALSVGMPDGSIVLMAGYGNNGLLNDVWRLPTAGSSLENPSHTYTAAGTYPVAMQACNAGGCDRELKTRYITVTEISAPELHITGPLSPGQTVPCLENATIPAANLFLASGSTIEHRTNGVTYIIRPDGSELGWAYDNETKLFNTATGPVLASYVHIIPQGSMIVPLPDNGGVLVGNISAKAPALKTINRNVIGAGTSSLPDVVCSPELLGCRVGMSSQNEQFLSEPLIAAGGYIPAFSLQSICDNVWLGSLNKLGSANPADISVLIMDKTLTNPDQPINFNLSRSNWTQGSGQNLYLTAKAELVNQSSGLQYTITGTSSAPVQMNITPYIWQTTDAGDELVFTGTPMLCTAATSCVATGSYSPSGNTTYFANATVLYTGSTTLAAAGEGVVGVAMVPGTVRVMTTDSKRCDAPVGPYIDFTIFNVNYPACTPSGSWQKAVCYDNAVIRWALAGDSSAFSSTLSPWMWKRDDNCPNPGHSFAVNSPFNKAIYIAGVKNTDTVWYHAIDAEHLTSGSPSESSWQDWNFFNYDNLNISIGNYQIPAGTTTCNTDVWIKSVTSVFDCGAYNGPIWKIFYIDSNKNVVSSQNPNCAEHPPTLKNKNETIPDDLKESLQWMNRNTELPISRWEVNSTNKELTFYAYDIHNEKMMTDIQGKHVGNYTILIVHDKEFEKNRKETYDYLAQLRKNPAYQIDGISMVTDAFGDPPADYAELWVYNLTTENKKLENTIIKGWVIQVYPVSM